jgi:hypothetical protein
MNPELREIFRTAIVKLARSASLTGIGTEGMQVVAAVYGIKPSAQECAEEAAYLVDKGLLVEKEKRVSPENKVWRITADGRDWLAEQGF